MNNLTMVQCATISRLSAAMALDSDYAPQTIIVYKRAWWRNWLPWLP